MCDGVLYSTTLVVGAKRFNFSPRPKIELLGPAGICLGNSKLKLRATSSFVDPEKSNFYGELDLLKEEENSNGIGEKGLSLKMWRGRQVMKRSNLIAKQVISINSARSLGFVSQLWLDPNSWAVLVLEVRPNLLSAESERFHLEDVNQVGDVVLVENESVLENEITMAGLETLVGYKVVTPDQRNIGKVRGYTLNINSGAVESLELDSFGVSIIPSSLVSTYALLVEDVLQVISDTVVVHEAAASHIQRLTKGFWGNQIVVDDYVRYKRGPKKNIELELPMDYL